MQIDFHTSCALIAVSFGACSTPAPAPETQPTTAVTAAPSERLHDPGFTAPVLAPRPTSGWYSFDEVDGRLHARSERMQKDQPERALALEIVAPRPTSEGIPSVSQVIALTPDDAGRTLEFSLGLRGSSKSAVRLTLYVWDDKQHAIELAHNDVTLGDKSSIRSAVRAVVPPGHDHLGVFVYLEGGAGTRFWLDDARLGQS